jgi:hypothetical protein
MSDVSRGPGWWLASDGKWYAPELHPNYQSSPTSPDEQESGRGPDADGAAAPAPEADEHQALQPARDVRAGEASVPARAWAADAPQGDGWWQGTDGKWYAPELYPSETPRADDWWQAANGRWYPPQFHPDEAVRAAATRPTAQRRDEQRRDVGVRTTTAATRAPTSPEGSPPGPGSDSETNMRPGAGAPEPEVPADVTDARNRVVRAQPAAAATAEAWTMVASSGSLTLSHSQHEYAVYDNERTFGRWPLGDEGYRDAVEAFQARKNEIGH